MLKMESTSSKIQSRNCFFQVSLTTVNILHGFPNKALEHIVNSGEKALALKATPTFKIGHKLTILWLNSVFSMDTQLLTILATNSACKQKYVYIVLSLNRQHFVQTRSTFL